MEESGESEWETVKERISFWNYPPVHVGDRARGKKEKTQKTQNEPPVYGMQGLTNKQEMMELESDHLQPPEQFR